MGAKLTVNKDLIQSRVTVDSVTKCWNWNMGKTPKGYAQLGFTTNGVRKNYRVSRLVWELWNGPIPLD